MVIFSCAKSKPSKKLVYSRSAKIHIFRNVNGKLLFFIFLCIYKQGQSPEVFCKKGVLKYSAT